MTVPSEINRSGPYNGNGVTTVFDYDFKIAKENYIKVVKADAAGVETILTLDADYIVSDVGNPAGGQVALTVPLPTGQTLTMIPNVPFTQEIDLENQGAYYAETVESGLDLSVMRDQQLQEQIDRAVLIPASEDPAQLGGLIGDILRLADSADAIDTVANNIGAVNTAASNMAAIIAAPAQAAAAAASAGAAAADRIQTGLDRTAAAGSAAAAAASASSVNLPAPAANTFLQRNAGNTAYDAKASPDVRLALGVGVYVADYTALRALDATKDKVAIVNAGRGIDGTFAWRAVDLSSFVLGAAVLSTAVNSGTETVTKVAHGLQTGDPVIATTAVNGLSTNTIYWVIRVDADNFRLASSLLNAKLGTAFNLTGTTNFTVRPHNDPQSGIYVTPAADITGASGAWVRQCQDLNVSLSWCDAIGDGVADDTLPIQGAVILAGRRKAAMYAPGGTYLHSEIFLPQRPTRIIGDGPSKTVFVNRTAGGNSFKFIALGNNRDPDDFALIKSVQFADLSVMKDTADGGVGIWAEWIKNDTNNQVYFSLDNVQVYCDQGTTWAFTKGVYLKNCDGSSWNNCVVKGDNSESASASANPYTMTHAIHFDQDTVGITTGNINHYMNNITTGASGYGLRVDGWYEGFFITNCSFVQHWKGVANSGSAALNSVFNMVNCHMDCRVSPVDFTNTFKLSMMNCDIFKNGGGAALPAGFAGDLVKLVGCMHAKFIGNTFGTTDTTLPIGINADSNSFRMTVEGNNFQSCSNAVVLNCTTNGAMVNGNTFYNCTVGVLLFTGTAGNRIGFNQYEGTFTSRISNLSAAYNHILPFKYGDQKTINFASALATQTVTFTVPAGVFMAAPRFASLVPAFNSGLYPVIIYDGAASSATSIVFQIREYQAATIAAGNYVFALSAEDYQ
jgi:hypothetical protein